MRIRTTLAALLLTALAVPLSSGIAAASTPAPRSCLDFTTRLEAQAALEARAADADRLDPDHNGFACQSRLGEPAVSDERATGDGGGAATIAFLLGGIAAGGLGAGALAQRVQAQRTPV